ncbi:MULTISPECIES: acyl carrier protein [unclassified Streptomyces]|uniref:acyl carrier protein n=1 Tax=unclassified Streptomyces TaxID=2593676 RepID=UPI00382BC045
MSTANVEQTVKGMLSSELMVEIPAGQMNADDSLRDVYGLDSLGFVELRVLCEENFGVTVSEDDFSPENFGTLGMVVSLVERLLKERESSAQSSG